MIHIKMDHKNASALSALGYLSPPVRLTESALLVRRADLPAREWNL